MVKRSSIITAAIILTGIIAILILGSGVWRKQQLDASSQEFALEITPRILTEGADVLLSHATSTFLQEQSNESITKYLFRVKGNLGELNLVESISGSSESPLLIFDDTTPTARYEINVSFAGGSALIKIQLRYERLEWLVRAFDVESNQLAD